MTKSRRNKHNREGRIRARKGKSFANTALEEAFSSREAQRERTRSADSHHH